MSGLRPPHRLLAALVPPLLFVALAWPGLHENSATYDETEHLPAGYVSLTRADHRLGPENPPLVKELFALPLLTLRPAVSAEAERAFAAAERDIDAHWIFGDRFLYQDNRPAPLLARARAVVLALGAGVVLLVFVWTREVFGRPAALLAASLAALDPNLLAHATLATTDVGYTLFLVAALYLVRRSLRALTFRDAALAAAALAAAFSAKHSAVLLLPILLVFAFIRLADGTPWPLGSGRHAVRRTAGRALTLACIFALWGLVAWGGLWAVYGFRYTSTADNRPSFPIAEWAQAIRENQIAAEHEGRQPPLDNATFQALVDAQPPGAIERAILAAARARLLPEACLGGLAFTTAKAQFRWSYYRGEVSGVGRASYFPFAFLVKTPLAAVALIVAALVLAARRGAAGRETLFIAVPPAIVLGAAMSSNLNIGYRHVLPMLPFLYALTGVLTTRFTSLVGPRPAAVLLTAATLLTGAETLAARPYFLSFFNLAAGGARGGLALLSDSNLDWGQGLPALRRWMAERGVAQVNLCYFGTADPAAYGIRFVPLAGSYFVEVPGAGRAGHRARPPVLPGYVAIGATHLQGTYLFPQGRAFYSFIRRKDPVAVLAGSIYVYWVERWGE